jgi:hypothetical protein
MPDQPTGGRTADVVRAFARDHWDEFAAILAEVLPDRVRHAWGEDPGYKRWFDTWQNAGFTLLPNHFYGPVPHVAKLGDALTRPLPMAGIDMRADAQFALLRDLAAYRDEYEQFRHRSMQSAGIYRTGGAYPLGDAELTYAMVRKLKPQRIVEIGSGMSTLLMAEACVRNQNEDAPCEFVSIDPFPAGVLGETFEGLTRHIATPVQEAPSELFDALGEGDILFIDSSHVLHPGNDVEHEYFRVLPNLAVGVHVHIHDVFLPYPYYSPWLTHERIFWNEQYILAAFLTLNASFEIILGAHYLARDHFEALADTVRGLARDAAPGSFWIRRVR